MILGAKRKTVSNTDVSQSAVIAESGTTTGVGVNITPYSSGLMLTPADLNTDTLTFSTATTLGGTYGVVNGASATGATGEWVPIPADAMKGAFLKVITGSAVAAETTISFIFKS